MTVAVNPAERDDLLHWAALITARPADPEMVAAVARPWLEWMRQAPGDADKRTRRKALYRQHSNLRLHMSRGDRTPVPSPEEFLAAAKALYAFTAPAAGTGFDPEVTAKLNAITGEIAASRGDEGQKP